MNYKLRILILMVVLLLAVSFSVRSEEDNTGAVVCVLELQDNSQTGTLPENGIVLKSYNPDQIIEDGMVFDGDDRNLVSNTKDYPYRAVAYMETHHTCGCEGTATGFMVAKNKLLTAAHCIVCSKHQKWADRITFYFGYRSSRDYTYKYSGKWYAFVGNTFPDGYTTDGDWAVIKLYKNVGDTVGWFGMMYDMPDTKITSKLMHMLGYKWGTMRQSYGFVETGSGNLIHYDLDTEKGNSGGPLYFLDRGDYYAVAINIAENQTYNTGYRITNEIYRYFLELDNY